jgi:FkbM family methyltransferase
MSPTHLPIGLKAFIRLNFPHKYGVLDRLYGTALSGKGITKVKTYFGFNWKLDLRNPTHRWCIYGSIFGPATSKWVQRNLLGGGTVIDSGANIGQTIIEFAHHPGIKIYAFEPLISAQEWICESLGFNQGMDVDVIPCGLYKEDCQLTIQVAGDDEIHGAHSTLRSDWYKDKNYERRLIDLVSLDGFAQRKGIERIRFWKLDVEGAELEALIGAERLLKGQQIDSLLVETKAKESGVMAYMAQFGYLPYLLDRNSRPTPVDLDKRIASEYIFLPTPMKQ